MKNKCNECGNTVEYSLTDKYYVIIYGVCWECDKKHWNKNELSLAEFEAREEKANEMAVAKGKLLEFIGSIPEDKFVDTKRMIKEDEPILMCSRVEDYDPVQNEIWELDANKSYPRGGVECHVCHYPCVMSNALYEAYRAKEKPPKVVCGVCFMKILEKEQ